MRVKLGLFRQARRVSNTGLIKLLGFTSRVKRCSVASISTFSALEIFQTRRVRPLTVWGAVLNKRSRIDSSNVPINGLVSTYRNRDEARRIEDERAPVGYRAGQSVRPVTT